MYPRDVMHVWPVPNYEVTGKNPWSRAFQRWAPLYVLLAVCAYVSYYRQSDAPWPFATPYQLVGVFFLMVHGAFLGALLPLRRVPRRWEPEEVTDASPDAIRARLNDLSNLPEPRWRTMLLVALGRCTHDGIRRSLEAELATRDQLSRQQNEALDLATQLVIARTAEPLQRTVAMMMLAPLVTGLAAGILLQFRREPVPHWHVGIGVSVVLVWCLDILLLNTLFRAVSSRAGWRCSNDLCVARALDEPQLLVDALRHMEQADWKRNDGPENFSAQYWRERREKLEAALRQQA